MQLNTNLILTYTKQNEVEVCFSQHCTTVCWLNDVFGVSKQSEHVCILWLSDYPQVLCLWSLYQSIISLVLVLNRTIIFCQKRRQIPRSPARWWGANRNRVFPYDTQFTWAKDLRIDWGKLSSFQVVSEYRYCLLMHDLRRHQWPWGQQKYVMLGKSGGVIKCRLNLWKRPSSSGYSSEGALNSVTRHEKPPVRRRLIKCLGFACIDMTLILR